MSGLVLPRLHAGPWPLLRAFGIACTSLGVGLLAFMARGALWPLAPGDDPSIMLAGSVAFLLSGMVAALLASAAWEVRSCPFAWNTPGVAVQMRREIRLVGFILFGAAAGTGATAQWMPVALAGSSWFLAIAAALGYAIGLAGHLSPLLWARFGGTLGLLLGVLPVVVMPEIAEFAASWGLLGMLVALACLTLAVERCGAFLERRGGFEQSASQAGVDVALFGRVPSLRAPRDGTDRFRGVRESDLDWVRALLHESYGAARGGLVGSALRFAIASVILTLLTRLFFHALASLRAMADETEAPISFSLDWFTQGFASRQEELIATNLVAAILGTLLWNRMVSTSTLATPLSRARRARVVWLKTQVEEAAAFCGIQAGFLALSFGLQFLSDIDPWPIIARFCLATTAVFALLPITRWMRLWWVDAAGPSRARDPRTEAQDPRVILVYAISMGVVVGGAILLVKVWQDLSVWMAVAALPSILALRGLWLLELRRFFRRADVAGC